ncbi:hypothetical protein LSCM1_05360 [Leishmania martiniquensis]|uniref:PUA domain-containing protein n=1 Tax=Leishmania martiniquensis TaxID=1580590 RepID=A0A836HFT4_9TRYP|nr:hypothetical protein LSCM1_05360 [Leishmania martiniquensis]
MINLDAYARYVYEYSSPSTTEHLRRTVWGPLGLCSGASASVASISVAQPWRGDASVQHEMLYAFPPVTTNARCVGRRIEVRLTELLEAGALSTPAVTTTAPTATAWASHFAPPSRLAAIGLPFCVCVKARTERLTSWPPLSPSSMRPSSSQAETSKAAASRNPPSRPLVVVVDVGAAEAVLRGSDLYAPGIVTLSRPFHTGERAIVAFYVERVASAVDEEQNGSFAAPRRLVSALPTGATLPAAQLEPVGVAADDQDEHRQLGVLADRSTFLVCIGSGVMRMQWKEIMSRSSRGTALQMEWTPQGQPSRATLHALLGMTKSTGDGHEGSSTPIPSQTSRGVREEGEKASDVLFLQNYSSMVPVALLVEHLSPAALRRVWTQSDDVDQAHSPTPCTILDACAAPGGKTSLLQERADQERAAMPKAATPPPSASVVAEPFRVVCCERSRSRHEQLMSLLHRHFSADAGGPSTSPSQSGAPAADVPYVTRTLESHCVDTNKFLKQKLTDAAEGSGGRAASHTDSFNAVLLDPPCTGMGLRPKLMPHMQSIDSIQEAADYQQALRLIHPPHSRLAGGAWCTRVQYLHHHTGRE